ncbi:MAG: B12-binding domain-containing radical SAM protein [Candidatus Omnitrophica bacterium]|jgi:radical SAM superfamily enzyme YgiQ (UPF0313 family)|nr:B12-binding domain-containing radical SAM protein [Candidatus Omnitrophota bacterium]
MEDIIFINPKADELGPVDFLVPKSVPLGLGSLAAYLMEKKYSVKIIDEEVERLTVKKIKKLTQNSRQLFGISCMTPTASRGYELADLIKSTYPDSTIVFGGIHPTVLPEEVLSNKSIDLVVKGEAEPVIERIVINHKNGAGFKDIPSCSYRDGANFIHNPRAPLIDINVLPDIPYHLFDPKLYDMGFVISSRGCPYNCVFCSQRAINGNTYRYRATDKVIKEIETLISLYKPSNIVFFDDIFTLNKKRIHELCSGIIDRGLNLKAEFTMVTRGDSIDEDLLCKLRAANFTGLAIGAETASEELMKMIDKKETVKDVVKGITLAKQHGFLVDVVFIYGLPGETREDRVAAFRLAQALDVAKARFNNATPYPGTRLCNIAKDENNLNIVGAWKNFTPTGALAAARPFKWVLPYYPKGSTQQDIIMDVIQANMLYFLQPHRLRVLIKNSIDRRGTKWLVLPPKWWLSIRYIYGLISVIFINLSRLMLLAKWGLQGKLLIQCKYDK